ncbi:MAG TPA: hypothetical protein VKU85_13190 [bacterium]|nr:hypothetical protein [bacterium]
MSVGARLRLVPVLVIAALVVGCATGGYRTVTKNGHEKVYKVDEAGEKNLVYEVSPDGELTVHDEADPRAQQALEGQRKLEQAQAAEVERLERIASAPKRADDDPIRVLIHEIELSEDLRQAQHTEGAVQEQLRKEFEGDAVIAVVDPAASQGRELTQAFRILAGQAPSQAPPSDVEVVTRAYVQEKVGINKSTKKVGSYAAVVFEATITSNYLPAEHVVTEEGSIFRNVEVTHKLAEKIKAVIKNEIGPTIPEDRNL